MTAQPLPLDQVTVKTPFFRGLNAPSLDLDESGFVESVVYVLRCKPQIVGGPFTWYVGRAPRCKLSVRMRQHLAGVAADFTAENKPLLVEALYPAARRSVEAYAFFSMMERLPVNALDHGRLGGWTQTRPKPSAPCLLLLKEQKRMLSDSCLACGSSTHFVGDKVCPRYQKWPDSAPLHCDNCHATIDITALGKTRTRPPASPAATPLATQPSSSAKRPMDQKSQVAAAPPQKKPRNNARVIVPERPCREFARVKICGREYTTLAWYSGKYNSERARNVVADKYGSHAVELKGGDHKTLVRCGYATTQRPPEILPGRTNLSSCWVDTACKAARPPRHPLQVRRGCSGRNVLWRVEDLAVFFDAKSGP